ncbi:MAG: ATP-binding protein, partial [Candidatus Methanomethylophilaceae archaeon]|nr:ATP-binding protein [Candidatus Methanomethylophilaceae archaeon]
MPMPMTGRTNELNALENEYMKESSMVVVTGRRGMGKTRLVSEFASGKNSLYFLATPVNEHVLLSELNAAVNRFCGLNEPASSWIGVLGRFASHYDNKKILIIDGFHNTASFGTKFLEGLRGIWDDILSQRNVTLILVGSLLPYMRSFTEDSDSPLYGAVSASLTLGPLPFRDTV